MIQKEACGIFHSCMYLQSLLLDRLFKIRTDHRNLLFIKEASNLMIVRWYMALSEFSFTLEFIPGVENDIADAMSRLGRNNMVDSLTPHKNILKNTFSQQFLHQPNQTKRNESQIAKIGMTHNSKVGHFAELATIYCRMFTTTFWSLRRTTSVKIG